MHTKILGRIRSAEFGRCRGRPTLMGLQLDFALSDGTGITNDGNLSYYAEGFNEEQSPLALYQQAKVIGKIYRLLQDAKVYHISELVDLPVEVTMDGHVFVSFRILKELL